jgi:hypothetical protein
MPGNHPAPRQNTETHVSAKTEGGATL